MVKRDSVPAEEVVRRLRENESVEAITRSLRERGILVSQTLVRTVARENGFVFSNETPVRGAQDSPRAPRVTRTPQPARRWGPAPVVQMVCLYLRGLSFSRVSLTLKEKGLHYSAGQVGRYLDATGATWLAARPEREQEMSDEECLRMLGQHLGMDGEQLLDKLAFISHQ